MPSHSPDHLLVCVVNSVEHAFSPGTFSQPENDLSIVRRTGKELFFMGMPSDYSDLIFMAFEAVKLTFELTDVKDFDLLVATASKEPVSIDGVPAHLVYCRIVSMNLVDSFPSAPRIPYLDVLIFAASENE